MADPRKHAEGMRRLAESGVKDRGSEALSFPNSAVRDAIYSKYRITSSDEGEARRGLKRFQRSSEYKRFSPYRKRLY